MPCLLMSVKKRKATLQDSNPKLETKVIGSIDRIYTFQKIADFQYLPMCTSISANKSQATNEKKSVQTDTDKTNAETNESKQ